MSYQALDEKSVIDYVKSRPSMERVFNGTDHLVAQEVGDGNLMERNQISSIEDLIGIVQEEMKGVKT